MSDYRRWCNFCGENITFGECGCKESKEAKKRIQLEFEEEKKKKHQKLCEAKRFLLSLGFNPGMEKAYDHNKEGWIEDPDKVKEHWVDNDRYNLVSYTDVANFIKKLQNPQSNVSPGVDIDS